MKCTICFEGFKKGKYLTLPCNCTYCFTCLSSYTTSKIKDNYDKVIEKLECPNYGCRKLFCIKDVAKKLPKKNVDLINEELLRAYITQTPDIITCPTKGCSFAGTMNSNWLCFGNLECPKCKVQWKDKSQCSITINPFTLFTITMSELFSGIWKKLFTHNCPKCQAPIQKNGGCPHMTCSLCHYQYCIRCKGYWHGRGHPICLFLFIWNNLQIILGTLLLLYLTGFLGTVYSGICTIAWYASYITSPVWSIAKFIFGVLGIVFIPIKFILSPLLYLTWPFKYLFGFIWHILTFIPVLAIAKFVLLCNVPSITANLRRFFLHRSNWLLASPDIRMKIFFNLLLATLAYIFAYFMDFTNMLLIAKLVRFAFQENKRRNYGMRLRSVKRHSSSLIEYENIDKKFNSSSYWRLGIGYGKPVVIAIYLAYNFKLSLP